MIKKTVKISEIILNPDNPRTIRDKKFKELVNSLKRFPEMLEAREIVLNTEMVILGGNMRYRAAKEAGLTEVPVKIVDWPVDKQREFIIKDNVSGGDWDWDALANEWDKLDLEEWGLEIAKIKDDTSYTRKVEIPVYEPKSDRPPELNKLYDDAKAEELRVKIVKSKLDKPTKEFLLKASNRFTSFNYALIAEYYSHADKETKELMEDLALVIIDYDKAIEKGFVKLVDSVMEQWRDEYEK